MSYSPGDLRREIRDVVAADLEAGREINRGWLVHALLSKHPLGAIKDRDFNVLCRQSAVVDAVREVLRDLKFAERSPEAVSGSGQLPLPGFKHLQRGYPVDRDGDSIIKPIQVMSDEELLAKAEVYETMADGCREHADELRRYVASRSVGGAAA